MGAATLQRFLYIVGGIEFTVQRYDPATNSWTLAAPLSSRRSSVCLVTDGHYLYSIGGLGDDDLLSCYECYAPRLNAWTKMTPMSEKRGCASGVCLNKKLYIFGVTVDAFSRNASISGEVYDITLNT